MTTIPATTTATTRMTATATTTIFWWQNVQQGAVLEKNALVDKLACQATATTNQYDYDDGDNDEQTTTNGGRRQTTTATPRRQRRRVIHRESQTQIVAGRNNARTVSVTWSTTYFSILQGCCTKCGTMHIPREFSTLRSGVCFKTHTRTSIVT